MKFGLLLFLSLLGFSIARAAAPVTFVFTVPPAATPAFSRDLWTEVQAPSGAVLRLPAFVWADGVFEVRARATEKGEYRLGRVLEAADGALVAISAQSVTSTEIVVSDVETRLPVRTASGCPPRLAFSNGDTYVPIGANLAWANQRLPAHLRMLRQFGEAGLNWTRVWMVHWSDLNLEWAPKDMGASPKTGTLDLHVAESWDQMIDTADEAGVYMQLVLQHHGQYTSGTDSSWAEHPWNAANGGFLKTPSEFFTSPEAKRLTALKYRYIVARWGYSPMILAWELFNEVHWTDPIREGHDETTIARWHAEMAAYIRQIDVYGHLITTSTDNLRSGMYAAMDYFQPHLYATNILANARRFDVPPQDTVRPMFYGEIGDDHLRLSSAEKQTGIQIVPPVWASLMGQGRYAAMPWLGEQMIDNGRLPELGAVAKFIAASGLGRRDGLEPFSPAIVDAPQIPFEISAGQMWQKRPAPTVEVAMDGRELLAYADIPRIYIGWPGAVAEGYPNHATLQLDLPKPTTIRVKIAGVGSEHGALRVTLDGQTVAEHVWEKQVAGAPAPGPIELPFPATAGKHTLVLANSGEAEWFDLQAIDLGLDTPVLAAVGQRSADFAALWVWHRQGVFAQTAPAAVSGKIALENMAAGEWRVTWWDSLAGVPQASQTLTHAGGMLQLPTPPISRHAAVILERLR